MRRDEQKGVSPTGGAVDRRALAHCRVPAKGHGLNGPEGPSNDGGRPTGGGIIGPLVFVAAARMAGVRANRPPIALRSWAQVGLGTYIGSSFNEKTVDQLSQGLPVILLATVACLVSSLGLADATCSAD